MHTVSFIIPYLVHYINLGLMAAVNICLKITRWQIVDSLALSSYNLFPLCQLVSTSHMTETRFNIVFFISEMSRPKHPEKNEYYKYVV